MLVRTMFMCSVMFIITCAQPSFNYCSDLDVVHGEHFSMNKVSHIQKRYYMIRRLEKPMKNFFAVHDKIAHELSFGSEAKRMKIPDLPVMTHPAIKKRLREMVQTGDTKPLHKIWYDFLAYKFIEDSTFVRETITTMLLFYKDLLLGVLTKGEHSDELIEYVENLYTQPDRAVIDEIMGGIEVLSNVTLKTCSKCHLEINEVLVGHHSLLGFQPEHEDEVRNSDLSAIVHLLDDEHDGQKLVVNNNMRFYHIQRLLKSIFILSRFKEMGIATKLSSLKKRNFNLLVEHFSHEEIKKCIAKMTVRDDLRPLFTLWKHFSEYDFIHDQVLLNEFVQLVVLVYRQLANGVLDKDVVQQPESIKRAGLDTVENVLEMYEKIADMPIPELLNLLDDVVDQFDTVMEKYEFNNSDLSWSAWWKKYWWAPPVIVGTLGATIVKHQETIFYFWDMIKGLLAKKAEESASASI